MSETKVTQKIIDDAAALKELIATDTEAAMEEMKKAETKSALHHLLNTDPDFRPKGYANATHFGLTDGTGVWVLENPSDETYRALRELQQAEPSMPENQKLEKVGATYYSHWNQNDAARQACEEQEEICQNPDQITHCSFD